MKKGIIITILILSISVVLVGCSKKKVQHNTNSTNVSATSNEDTSIPSEEKTFTLDELSKYTGKNGSRAYVAVNGVVYDVTDVDEWNNEAHKNGITAGKDLTKEISKAPHKLKVLDTLPIVGLLK